MKAKELCSTIALILAAMGGHPASTLAQADLSAQLPAYLGEVDEGEDSSSYGGPVTAAEAALQAQFLQGPEIPGTTVPESENVQQWTDTQLLDFHRDELKETAFLLEGGSPALEGGGYQLLAQPRRARMSGVSCLAIALQGEAGGEPAAGKRAVAQTIMRRALGNAGRVCAVVFAHRQFEAMSKRLKSPTAETLRIAHTAIQSDGKSCGFDHFIAKGLQRRLGRAIPAWVRRFEQRGCYHKRIGNQDYYASCNCRH